jgi:hypothetical protein
MAHLFAPRPLNPELPMFFNVDGVVGAPPAQNKREDVVLVQFAFKLIADFPIATTNPEVLVAAKAVKITGTVDAATINAIRASQSGRAKDNPAKVVDGRVSPAKGGYSYGGAFWTIVRLNDSMQERLMDIWPRIDKLPSCPAELKTMVMREVVGK